MTGTSSLLGDLFEDPLMVERFGDTATLQGMLDFEAALTEAQAGEGIVPAAAVAPIAAACRADLYDIAEIGRQATLAGNPAIPMVKLLTAEVTRHDVGAARWVHWGATSQDAIDSGRAGQIRAGLSLILDRAGEMAQTLADLAETHRHTVMPGRTLLQHALPTTFGLKAAYWLDAITGHVCALRGVVPDWPAPLGGAAGTLASLGARGAALQLKLAADNTSKAAGLPIPFHTTRQEFARVGCELGLLAGTLGKIARDIMLLMQTEVAEVFEPAEAGKGGSSALPHKRNPVQSLAMAAIAQRTPGLVSTLLVAMTQEHERAIGGWHAEWEVLPELFVLAGASLNHALPLLKGLEIDAHRMRTNLDLTHGLILSERVALALGETLGRTAAKTIVEDASRAAIAGRRHLRDVLGTDPLVTASLDERALDALFDPATYLGATQAVIDRALARFRAI